MQPRLLPLALAAAALALAACGSSPTEPTSSASGPRTSLKITVTTCGLGGSVDVWADSGMLGTLPTPGEATFSLPPGPHQLTQFRRGTDMYGWAALPTTIDPLGQIPMGSTATISIVDPFWACVAHP